MVLDGLAFEAWERRGRKLLKLHYIEKLKYVIEIRVGRIKHLAKNDTRGNSTTPATTLANINKKVRNLKSENLKYEFMISIHDSRTTKSES